MIRCRSEVEEAVRMISSTYSSKTLSRNYKAKNSPYGSRFDNRAKCLIAVDALADNVDICWAMNKYPGLIVNESFISSHIACFQLGSRRAWKGDLGIGEEVVTCKVYLGLAFTIPTLERVAIGCCGVGGGGGDGVVGGVGVVCGDAVDRGVGDVDCGVVKASISAMIVRVPKKDRWCGTRGKFVRWKAVRVTKASKRAKMGVRVENHNAIQQIKNIETHKAKQEEKVNMCDALDAGLVVTESSGQTRHQDQVQFREYTTTRLWMQIYDQKDEDPFADEQLTALHNNHANEQQHN
ncbi:hypothetical protein Tco_0588669 [Tanacetum coccineum]